MLTDSNNPAADALSLLEADLTNQETSFPVLEAGTVDFVIIDMKLEPTKKGNGYMLNTKLKTTMPWKTNAGVEKPAGFPMRNGIFIPHPTGDNDEAVNMAKSKLAQLKEAALGDKTGAFGRTELYIGKPVTGRVIIKVDPERGPQNEIAAYVKRT